MKVGHYLAWSWMRLNWSAISQYFDVSISSSVGKIIKACAKGFNNEIELKELQTFYEARSSQLGTGKRDAETAIESAKSNLQWMTKYYGETVTWFENAVSKFPEPEA